MRRALACSALLALLAACPAMADAPKVSKVTPITLPAFPLGEAKYGNGKVMTLDVGFGSAAIPGKDGLVYFITDRGPNIDCSEAKDLIGLDAAALCAGDESAKNFPMPDFAPTLFTLKIEGNAAEIVNQVKLTGASGRPITGLPNPLKAATTETGYDVNGKALPFDPSGLDTEGLAMAPDGSFWIGEEYAPSIVHISADGKILERIVPKGIEGDLANADYPVTGALPAILALRYLNRGIESVALSPDGAFAYFAVQSPLANPDKKAYASSRQIRLIKFDLGKKETAGEYLYPADEASTFIADNKKKLAKQSDVKISEVTALGADRLLVLERIAKTTKLYIVDLNGATALPASMDDRATSPSFEQMSLDEAEKAGATPLTKTLVLDTDSIKGIPSKVESVAVLNPHALLLTNDDDFGIAGDVTQMVRVEFETDVLK
ncbi:esterase-like activity of phytase family protein [soil metagenome]